MISFCLFVGDSALDKIAKIRNGDPKKREFCMFYFVDVGFWILWFVDNENMWLANTSPILWTVPKLITNNFEEKRVKFHSDLMDSVSDKI